MMWHTNLLLDALQHKLVPLKVLKITNYVLQWFKHRPHFASILICFYVSSLCKQCPGKLTLRLGPHTTTGSKSAGFTPPGPAPWQSEVLLTNSHVNAARPQGTEPAVHLLQMSTQIFWK